MESNVINVNIQLPNNTFLENYEIPSEKSVGEVLQDLQDALNIPKFVEHNQFILALTFRGYILSSSNTFGELGIKSDSFLKVKKIPKINVVEKDYYKPKTPIAHYDLPPTAEVVDIPEQPLPTMELPEYAAEKVEHFQSISQDDIPTAIPDLDITEQPVAQPFNSQVSPPVNPKSAPPKKKRSKILTAVIAILGTLALLSVAFAAFIFFQFGYASKFNIPYMNVNLNTNSNANTNANSETNVNTNAANADSSANGNAKTENSNSNANVSSNVNTSSNANTSESNKETSVGVSSEAQPTVKEEPHPKLNANTNANNSKNSNN